MLQEEELTYRIRGCVYEVYRQLGHGFLEKVYERALLKELSAKGLRARSQVPIKVHYKTEIIGEYFADIVVENRVIIETKAQPNLGNEHDAQLMNYLRATNIHVGLLINFAYPKATVKRIVL